VGRERREIGSMEIKVAAASICVNAKNSSTLTRPV